MFSYRHGFHAGNHADVLKHVVLVQILDYFAQKEAPYWYIDTHAGAGIYELDGAWANKRAEYKTGIARLWEQRPQHPLIDRYLQQIQAWNEPNELVFYPGSPFIAANMVRDKDRLRLFEMHPTENTVLQDNFAQLERPIQRRTMFYDVDGFTGIKAILPPPPPTRRGVCLLDPSYEDKRDYAKALQAVQDGLQRFPTGCYAIWYPLVAKREMQQFVNKLEGYFKASFVHVQLQTMKPPQNGMGLFGSGMFIVNPPWTLIEDLQQVMPILTSCLAQDESARFYLNLGN